MRAIKKSSEPTSLTAHRKSLHSNYDNYVDKDALRESLVSEQRGLCCYCMGRIHDDASEMKIEHWKCQGNYPDLQLNYSNLLGSCSGRQGAPHYLQHCDTHKGNLDLMWNPADPLHNIETRVRYEVDGSIQSDDPIFNAQLNDVLNLNIHFLKSNRKAVFDAIIQWWGIKKAQLQGPVPRKQAKSLRDKWDAGSGSLKPYCQVAVWLLDQRLARMKT